MNLRDAAILISEEVVFVSHTTLARLEAFPEPPADRRRRQLACLALLTYGFDPADFGLGLDDVPASVNLDRFLERAKERALRMTCFTVGDDLAKPALQLVGAVSETL